MLAVGGENLIDLVQIDTSEGLPLFKAIPGGSPFNVAMAAGRQGLGVRYLTPISTDASGELLARRLTESAVEIAAPRNEAPSSLAMVTLTDCLTRTLKFFIWALLRLQVVMILNCGKRQLLRRAPRVCCSVLTLMSEQR